MEWRGVTITNVYVANFFFVAALGLVISAQWELSVGNGFAYTVYSAFGKFMAAQGSLRRKLMQSIGFFYAGYAAILTPSFGVQSAYGSDAAQYNNALGFFVLRTWISPFYQPTVVLTYLKSGQSSSLHSSWLLFQLTLSISLFSSLWTWGFWPLLPATLLPPTATLLQQPD